MIVITRLTQNILAENPNCHGAMFVPIILGSDKTTVSIATGQHDYYPIYISNGNVHNDIRCAHAGAVSLLGFLPVPKGWYYYRVTFCMLRLV